MRWHRTACGRPSLSAVASERVPQAFLDALDRALERDRRTDAALLEAMAERTGRSYAAGYLGDWRRGKATPKPADLFALEETLDLGPGALSQHLGFLPVGARTEVRTVTEAIAADDQLTPDQKEILLATYAASVRLTSSSGSTA